MADPAVEIWVRSITEGMPELQEAMHRAAESSRRVFLRLSGAKTAVVTGQDGVSRVRVVGRGVPGLANQLQRMVDEHRARLEHAFLFGEDPHD